MKSSSQLNLPLPYDEVNIADVSLEDAVQCFPIMGKLKELCSALPIRCKFRFTYIQKKLLYGYFIEGGKTGKKTDKIDQGMDKNDEEDTDEENYERQYKNR